VQLNAEIGEETEIKIFWECEIVDVWQ
jgi:hypothetical protein